MSDSPAPNSSSTESQPSESAASPAAKPKTSWVGRIVIGILLVVLAFEGIAHLRAASAEKQLKAELDKSEATEYTVTSAKVREILGGREPDETKLKNAAIGDELYEIYYFKGLLKNRVVCVHYGVEGQAGTVGAERELLNVLNVIPEAILYQE